MCNGVGLFEAESDQSHRQKSGLDAKFSACRSQSKEMREWSVRVVFRFELESTLSAAGTTEDDELRLKDVSEDLVAELGWELEKGRVPLIALSAVRVSRPCRTVDLRALCYLHNSRLVA
jgi:hypothetical protein